MKVADFKLERYFARWELAVPYMLGSSDVEPYPLGDVLALADDEGKHLWAELSLGYTDTQGHILLRSEIAALYSSVTRDDVLVSAPTEGILLFFHASLDAGDHAIVVCPTYQALYEAARSTKAEVTLLWLQRDNGWTLDLMELKDAVRPNTRVIAISFPQNPTGAMLDGATFDGVVGIARQAGAWLFADEMFRFLEFDAADRLPAGVDSYERGVSLGGLSKSFAMGGLRIGWLATRNRELHTRMARLKDYTSVCSSAPSEILAVIALRARERVLLRSREIVAANLERLDGFFADRGDAFNWVRPRAGTVGFPALRDDWPIDEFAKELAEREGVLVIPGSVFEFPGNHFRIGFGRRNMAAAVDRLEGFAFRR